jgi:Domain of unknown function (DUF4136)
MRTLKILPVIALLILASCASVHVNADYDKKANFSGYKTYAYLKSGIDKAEISDLDKKRILYAIDETMAAKGFTKTENADVIISFFTKERERQDYYNNFGMNWGWNWGWNPWWGMNTGFMSTSTEGTLIIDVIDGKTKELVWQGKGTGYLTENTDKKDARAKEFVSRILEKYPPNNN